MSNILEGKVALVTGGSRGLGSGIATALADHGATVAFTYVTSDAKAAAMADQLRTRGRQAMAIKSDQGDPTTARGLIDAVMERFGALDILVNNAALAVQGSRITDALYDLAAIERMWSVNVTGVLALIRAAAVRLRAGGRIISIGSGLGSRVGWPGAADYAATKAAINGFSRGAARDLAPRAITVNVVNAGIMDTDMTRVLAPDGVPPQVLGLAAVGRMVRVDEVAAAVAFLASPAASSITGTIIEASGGYLA